MMKTKTFKGADKGGDYARPQRDKRLVERYRASGLTQEVFAREEGISVWTLRHACRRVGKVGGGKKKAAALIEVETMCSEGDQKVGSRNYRIELEEGPVLTVPEGFRPEEVQSLLELLRRQKC